MARPKTDRQFEVKLRLTEAQFNALLEYRRLFGFASNSSAGADIVGSHLLGVIGRMPKTLAVSGAKKPQSRPETAGA